MSANASSACVAGKNQNWRTMRCTRRNRPPSTRDILPDVLETALLCACYRGSSRSLLGLLISCDPLPPAFADRGQLLGVLICCSSFFVSSYLRAIPNTPRISPPRRGGDTLTITDRGSPDFVNTLNFVDLFYANIQGRLQSAPAMSLRKQPQRRAAQGDPPSHIPMTKSCC